MRLNAQGTQVAVKCRQQVLHHGLKRGFLLAGKQAAFVGASQKVSRFVERTAGGADEALMVGGRCTPIPFGDIGPYAVGGADDLVSYSGASKCIPVDRSLPHEISQLLGHGVNLETFESKLEHNGDSFRGPSC